MMRPRRALSVLIVLIMASWACSLEGAGGGSQGLSEARFDSLVVTGQ